MADVSEQRAGRGRMALAAAWLALTAVIALAGGYLVFQRHAPRPPVVSLVLPESVTPPEAGPPDEAPGTTSEDDGGTQPTARETAGETAEAAPADTAAAPDSASGSEPEAEAGSGPEPEAAPEPQSEAATATSPEVAAPVAGEPGETAEEAEPPAGDSADEIAALPKAPAAPGLAEPAPEDAAAATPPAAESARPEASSGEAPTGEAPTGEAPTGAAPTSDEATPEAPTGEEAASEPPASGPGDEPPWQRYAALTPAVEGRPRVAVVVVGLGLSSAATEAAIKQLPSAVTLSFSPYGRTINEWVALARANGHEVMIDLPMEPLDFPQSDPGPHALLTSLGPDENLDRLDWILDRATSYVGVAAMMGSRFIASEDDLYPVLKALYGRGLLFLDNRVISNSATRSVAQRLGMPLLVGDRTIDETQASRISIDARLAQIERLALANGSAVALGQPYPVTLERLRAWTAALGPRGLALVPITALAKVPTLQ